MLPRLPLRVGRVLAGGSLVEDKEEQEGIRRSELVTNGRWSPLEGKPHSARSDMVIVSSQRSVM